MARKILLADDSVTAQNMGRKILSDAGYDVVTVNNGSAALKRVAEQRPDLIVLDVYMPGYSGLEVCQRLKDSPDTDGIPILLTVGKLEPFKPEEARRVRAEAYIVKPFEASELLTALTRLEDQMVPGRTGGKSEGHGDSETGWKNRLRFPTKKKKEETEPEPEMDFTAGTSRASRRGKPAAHDAAGKTVPDIPRDITPEELDALSALAAKLDGESSASMTTRPAEKTPTVEAPKEFEVAAPATDDKKKPGISSVDLEAQPAPADTKTTAETPSPEPIPVAAEAKQPEVVPVRVDSLAEKEPGPVDKNDEPLFASAPVTTEPAAEEKLEIKHEVAGGDAAASASSTAPHEIQATTRAEKPAAETAKVEAAVPATAAARVQAQDEQESPAPSEEELREALRLLTPSAADSSSSSAENLVATGDALSREAAHNAIASSQWMAVAVAVDPADATRSLEAEMFQTLGRSAELSNTATSAVRPHKETILEATPVDEPAAVTFAEAVRHDDEAVTPAEKVAEPAVQGSSAESAQPVADATAASTSNAAPGGEESMGNERGNKNKANGHQIRTATPAANDAVEAVQQTLAEQAPKAMAAAADGARSAVPDPSAIANIVDSVLADLRPKIVEEISKKLAGK